RGHHAHPEYLLGVPPLTLPTAPCAQKLSLPLSIAGHPIDYLAMAGVTASPNRSTPREIPPCPPPPEPSACIASFAPPPNGSTRPSSILMRGPAGCRRMAFWGRCTSATSG